jgi:hypothetical protein
MFDIVQCSSPPFAVGVQCSKASRTRRDSYFETRTARSGYCARRLNCIAKMRLSVQLAGRIVEGDGALFTFAPASARSRERNRALSSGHCRVLGEKEIVMPLVNFIRSHTEEIAEKWEEFAKTLPAARGMAEPALRDHLPRILQAITDDMEKVANAARQSKKDIFAPMSRLSG